MLRLCRHLMLAFALLVQGMGSAWAAAAMPATATPAPPQAVEVEADAMPPCHGSAQAVEAPDQAPHAAMPCCDESDCDCGVGCMVHASAPLPVAPELGAYLRMHFESLGRLEPPRPAHPHALLRPPAPVHG